MPPRFRRWCGALTVPLAALLAAPAVLGAQRPTEPVVPAIPPDSVPAWLYADSSLVPLYSVGSAAFVRDVVIVYFRAGTPQRDRQAAVRRVAGTVVGGARLFGDDGAYLVRLPVPAGPPGDAWARLQRARAVLDSLPQVEVTAIEVVDELEPDSASARVDTGARPGRVRTRP